jgi:hypothetical protein
MPYVSLLFDEGKADYKVVLKTENATLLEVPHSYLVEYGGEHKLLFQSGTKYIYRIVGKNSGEFLLKKANYPGWKVGLNSEPITHDPNSPFIKFSVPPGEHIVTIEYAPTTFLIGLFLSTITFLLIMIYFLRNLLSSAFGKRFLAVKKDITDKVKNTSSNKLLVSILIIVISQVTLFIFINKININISQPDYYPVVNWFSVNSYSIYNDYLKALLYVLSVPTSLALGAIYLLWGK